MKQENLTVYYGEGRGKTNAAIGKAILAAGQGRSVDIIQFFKAKNEQNDEYFKRLEPEIKLFRFQRSEGCFDDLTPEQKEEECMNMKNGINFAKKVMTTRECDLLILDEFLGLVQNKMFNEEELSSFFAAKPEEMELILTGQELSSQVRENASEVYNITVE
jgi:cob(I)alamin adenosyltransferase